MQATREVAQRYPSIKYEEMIVDNTCMQLVSKPHQFDVMVGQAHAHACMRACRLTD